MGKARQVGGRRAGIPGFLFKNRTSTPDAVGGGPCFAFRFLPKFRSKALSCQRGRYTMRRWFRRWQRRRSPEQSPRGFRPAVEGLEDRCLLAAPVIAPLSDVNVFAGKTLVLPVLASSDTATGSNRLTYSFSSTNSQITAQE